MCPFQSGRESFLAVFPSLSLSQVPPLDSNPRSHFRTTLTTARAPSPIAHPLLISLNSPYPPFPPSPHQPPKRGFRTRRLDINRLLPLFSAQHKTGRTLESLHLPHTLPWTDQDSVVHTHMCTNLGIWMQVFSSLSIHSFPLSPPLCSLKGPSPGED